MKKWLAFVLALAFAFALTGCGGSTHEVEITIPADSTEAFVFSDEEVFPAKDTLTIWAGEGLSDTEVVLKSAADGEIVGGPTYLTRGMPVKLEVKKGSWYQIGVATVKNPSGTDIVVSIEVEDADIRIE